MNPSQDRSSRTGRTRLRTLPLPVLLGAMLLAGLCALLALNTASAAQELKQRTLTDSNASTSDVEQQLVRDLAAIQAPGALASAAQAQGLVPNPNPAFLRINADGSVTVLGSPMPASVPPPPVTPTVSKSPSATPSAKPNTTPSGKPPASSSKKSPNPVVTVTVTKAAPATSASRSAHPRPTPTPTGVHR
ncbi:MAG: hypothetical protein M3Y42_19755 [Actinomycetota bacterium]|nr:hypothetical protein [Actinomycetota bacterium]MDQ2959180.1 hypothetical protein [Actinomycetota bacterium]